MLNKREDERQDKARMKSLSPKGKAEYTDILLVLFDLLSLARREGVIALEVLGEKGRLGREREKAASRSSGSGR